MRVCEKKENNGACAKEYFCMRERERHKVLLGTLQVYVGYLLKWGTLITTLFNGCHLASWSWTTCGGALMLPLSAILSSATTSIELVQCPRDGADAPAPNMEMVLVPFGVCSLPAHSGTTPPPRHDATEASALPDTEMQQRAGPSQKPWQPALTSPSCYCNRIMD